MAAAALSGAETSSLLFGKGINSQWGAEIVAGRNHRAEPSWLGAGSPGLGLLAFGTRSFLVVRGSPVY